MTYNIRKHHPKRPQSGGAGTYLHDMDGKLILVSEIEKIEMQQQWGSHIVAAVMKNGKTKDLFGSSDYEMSKGQLDKYLKEYEFLKGVK